MSKKSAGLLVYRKSLNSVPEVLLVHPGGPFWRNKDEGAWSIPKGEFEDEEEPLAAAQREFAEELGSSPPQNDYLSLGSIKQKNGKTVHAWAVKGAFDTAHVKSCTFTCEWPPRSGRVQEFPEIDRAEWFVPEVAKEKILAAQSPFIDRLVELLSSSS